MKTAVITGGSSGIGLYTARELARNGIRVFELSRREFEEEGITHIPCDITAGEDIRKAFEIIKEKTDSIDILINNAGMGISGSGEFTPSEDIKKQFGVNIFGTLNMIRGAVPLMREKGGRIVNISSVAAITPIPFQSFYSATKAAINSFTMSLGLELSEFNISVCAVMPGDTKTGFTDARKKNNTGDSIYGNRIERSVSKMEKDERQGSSPEKAGKYIAKIAMKEKVRPLYTIGSAYKVIAVLVKILPASFVKKVIGMLYL